MKNNDLRQKHEREWIDSEKVRTSINQNKEVLQKSLESSIQDMQEKSEVKSKEIRVLSERLEQVCSVFLPHFAKADLLALKYQMFYKDRINTDLFFSCLSSNYYYYPDPICTTSS